MDFEEAIDRYNALADSEDDGRWQQADIVKGIDPTLYGAFSYRVNMATRTVRERAQIGAFYPAGARAPYREGGLRWSHFRMAARLGSLDEAKRALDTCIEQDLRVEGLAEYIKARRVELGLTDQTPPPVNIEFEAYLIYTTHGSDASENLLFRVDRVPANLTPSKRYRLVAVPVEDGEALDAAA